MNVECDFVDHTVENLDKYKLLLVPPLYTASDAELKKLNDFVERGGHILYGFKSGFTNEHVQVRQQRQPAVLREAAGFSYQQFTGIDKLPLQGDPFKVGERDNFVSIWAELLTAETATVLGKYDHPYWGRYATITENKFGNGTVTYIGSWPSEAIMKKLMRKVVTTAGVRIPEYQFPVIIRRGVNDDKRTIHYIFNYSQQERTIDNKWGNSTDILTNSRYGNRSKIILKPWDLVILEKVE
jgi:beta-galactosidase